jgi:hypothetical protein
MSRKILTGLEKKCVIFMDGYDLIYNEEAPDFWN